MKCPACKEHNLMMTERQGVEIDYCPECRGIWLDRGELDKILEKARAEESPRRDQDSRGEPRHEPRYEPRREDYKDSYKEYKYKRKKSLLEELFD